MTEYYVWPGQSIMSLNHDTKEVINVLNIPNQSSIKKINELEFYNKMLTLIPNFQPTNEQVFRSTYQAALSNLNDL